ncbi:SDR family NAD(P)-dependent oxidoreductase [Zhongshania sp.]|jgi:NAD(P)-dependent dehydrogenase (short-subunit alcohol dehydrogenase family)|uniref:SDR family NAD(P)-dependent oxidoreductase n=1 Tax=Zhongshania sp. TaxID=1971902 RepID=UPI0039E2A389
MDPLLDFTDQVALITGAASGFGKLIAEGLAQRGAKVVLGDVNEDVVESLAEKLRADGGQAVAQRCDVALEEDCQRLVATAVERFGRLDIAVNNAGISHDFTPFEEIQQSVWTRQWEVNVNGVQFGMKHQITQMKKQGGGNILNLSSMAGIGGAPGIAAYGAAKHAVVGLTKSAAAELGPVNIRVNAACPFFTLTPMVAESSIVVQKGVPAAESVLSRGCVMKRLGQPDEVANTMILLLSPANTYMTGQCIAISGGALSL